MCGIAGLLGAWTPGAAAPILRSMMDAIAHRGPDGEGIEVEAVAAPGWTLGLGHRRLAILDLSDAGLQPMRSADGRFTVIYNGEIYNYLELREELRAIGYAFHTGTDTEVLLAAYAAWGVECLTRFNGMWAFALWDQARQSLLLARDRIGVKPLYYARSASGWLFASEPKALFASREVTPRYRPAAVEAYLSHGLCSFDEETFFEGVLQVPPGCFVTCRTDAPVVVRRYWDLPEAPDGLPPPTADELRSVFLDAVAVRLRSDVRVGVSLSGGVDSSSIAGAVATRVAAGAQAGLSTFTVSYPGAAFDESSWASAVSQQLGGTQVFARGFQSGDRDLDGDLRGVIQACDEPIHSPSIFNTMSLMRTVRASGVTVVLGGQAADEMFWGYPWCYAYSLAHWMGNGQRRHALRELAAIVQRGNVPPRTIAAYTAYQAFFTPRYLRGVARARRYLGTELQDVARPEEVRLRCGLLPYRAIHRREVLSTNLPVLLRYEDRLSMRFGVEARLPFCDYRIAELAHRCRPDQLLHDGWSKHILRDAMHGLVPDDILWRREKRGFPAPVESLIDHATQLRAEACDTLPELRGLLDLEQARAAISGTLRAPWQMRWRLMNLVLSLQAAKDHARA